MKATARDIFKVFLFFLFILVGIALAYMVFGFVLMLSIGAFASMGLLPVTTSFADSIIIGVCLYIISLFLRDWTKNGSSRL